MAASFASLASQGQAGLRERQRTSDRRPVVCQLTGPRVWNLACAVGLHTRWGPARVDGLHNRRFSEPVTVHRVHADGTVHPTLIITTKDAYDALIEVGHALANPAWQAALDAIVRALLDPTPENVEAGRIAFDRLHHPRHPGSSQPRRA